MGDSYKVRSAINIHGFEIAWDIQNMDLTIFVYAVHQKQPEFVSSKQQSMVEILYMLWDILLGDNKDKCHINNYGKNGYVAVLYLISTC